MARKSTFSPRAVLRKLFPTARLKKIAHESGAVVRNRKVKIEALFWTVVLGFGIGRERTIAGLRRAYEKTTGQRIEESSFYNRFTPGLVKMLKQATAEAFVQSLGIGRALKGHLAVFRDVVLTDSTVVRLHDFLQKVYPACRTNHTLAALKAHAIMSVTGAGKQSVKITSERCHDGPVFRVGQWIAGTLLLFDLGYYRFQLFSCIRRNGGYFVSRLKTSANPRIVELNRAHRGRAVHVVGEKLRDVVGRLQREVLDVMVEVRFQRRIYAGRRRYDVEAFRVVGVRDEATGNYHLYITNLPPELLSAEDIQSTYALRWEVELLFKEWKRHYRLGDMPSRKKVVVEALLYASLLTLVVSRRLLDAVRRKLVRETQRLKPRRWAAIFESVAQELLAVVVRPRRQVIDIERRVTRTLLHEAPDPNVSRPGLIDAVELGVHRYHHCAAKTG